MVDKNDLALQTKPGLRAYTWMPRTTGAPYALVALLLILALAGCGGQGEPGSSEAVGSAAPGVTSTASVVNSDQATAEATANVVSDAPATFTAAPTLTAVPTGPVSTPGSSSATNVPEDAGGVGGVGGQQSETTHTVKEGDTLSGIAAQYNTTVEALMQANRLDSADFIYVGQVLTIVSPDAVAEAPNTTATAPPSTTQATQAATEVAQAPAATQAVPPTEAPAPPAPTEQVPTEREPVVVNGRTYDAYIPSAIQKGQFFQYTCEFDAVWIIMKTYGYDVGLERQIELIGLDTSIEPYYEQTPEGVVVYGGDITNYYSGDYKKNFLARSTGTAIRKVFDAYGLGVTYVRDRASLEAALLRGELVWIKTTVDFKPWTPVTWVMPDGSTTKGVLGNDHALVVMGFSERGVVIRDPLGPTSTNRQRQYEYEVPWDRFMSAWGAQLYDGVAVAPPAL